MPSLQTFPPRLVVRGHRDVGENRVAADGLVGVAVGLGIGARHDAEIAGLGIDGIQPPVLARVQPGDVIAHRPDLPALVARRRNQHGEIGLAAGRREGAGEIMGLALRVLDADDQHVLGEPALGARLPARDPQRVAFLAEQRVAAVARTEALDRQLLGEMHDEAPRSGRARRWSASPSRICLRARCARARGRPMRVMSFMLSTT